MIEVFPKLIEQVVLYISGHFAAYAQHSRSNLGFRRGLYTRVRLDIQFFARMSAVQGQTEARTRLLTLSRLRRYTTNLDRALYTKTVTKNIIVSDFLMGKWSFSKTCGTDQVSTRFKHLKKMIYSWVCPTS